VNHRPTERVRIGAVNYLNTKPLIYDLETLAADAELILCPITHTGHA
jgi:hypothetical protein